MTKFNTAKEYIATLDTSGLDSAILQIIEDAFDAGASVGWQEGYEEVLQEFEPTSGGPAPHVPFKF